VAHEGSRVEGDADLRERIVSVLPGAAVERVHVSWRSGQDAHGHAAGDNLSVGSQIGLDAIQSLHAADVRAEAGDDFVKDKRGA